MPKLCWEVDYTPPMAPITSRVQWPTRSSTFLCLNAACLYLVIKKNTVMIGAAFRRRQAQFLSSSFVQHQHYVIDQNTLVLNEWTFSEIFHQNIRVCVFPGSSLHHRRSFLPCCNPIAQLVSCSWAPALGTWTYQVPTRHLPSCPPHFRSFFIWLSCSLP